MVSFFERIPNRLPESSPLAHFILCDELLIFDNVKNTMTCVVISFTDDFTDIDEAYADAERRVRAMETKMVAPVSRRVAEPSEKSLQNSSFDFS
jgi:anthranilate synthase component 1